MAGLTLPDLLRAAPNAAAGLGGAKNGKSVILLWMAGGPSHIDTWDVKPERPYENRGPFSPIGTKLPGVLICEHLPKQAALLDRFTLIRSVDARHSNHEPNQVFQTGNLDAPPAINPDGDSTRPSARSGQAPRGEPSGDAPLRGLHGGRPHLAWGGWLGQEFDPFIANRGRPAAGLHRLGVDTGRTTGGDLFQLPRGLTPSIHRTAGLCWTASTACAAGLDAGEVDAMDRRLPAAGGRSLRDAGATAFDLSREPEKVRDALRKAPLVPAGPTGPPAGRGRGGVRHARPELPRLLGHLGHHGDNIPPYGGITRGSAAAPALRPPDHDARLGPRRAGPVDDVLVIAMGEFGRTPQMGTQESTDGRNHWPA